MADEAYRDESRSIEERVDDLLGRMTPQEKVAQLGCVWPTQLVRDGTFSPERAARRLANGIGHVTRIAATTSLRPVGLARFHNEVQRHLLTETRLGIPAVIHEEAVAGFCARDATQFPHAIGLAATWDPALMSEIGEVIRRQMTAVGARHTLSPVLDIGRDPRWGRVEETYGEDPELAGQMAVAYVRGVQGNGDPDGLPDGVACTGKHFLGYSVADGGLNHGPVQLGGRELREVFAEPFAAAIRDAGLASVMNSYSSVDGIACAASRVVLTELLRAELGFCGTVVADYESVNFIHSHHRIAADKQGAAVAALNAGLDMELPALDCYGQPLLDALDAGLIDPDVVDTSVRRVLVQKFALGLFDDPFVDEGAAAVAFGRAEDVQLARRAAAESVVMLRNDGVLPLANKPASIAVIGPHADDLRLTQGDYHYPTHLEILTVNIEAGLMPESGGEFAPGAHFPETVTPLEALRARYPSTRIEHVAGCEVAGDDRSGIDDARRAAAAAEVALVFVGGRSGLMPDSTTGEARDTADLTLTGVQTELVEAVASTGTPTVVIVMSGRVHALEREDAVAGALLLAWPGGQQAGAGIVDVLSGDVSPSGRLPVSLPRRSGQVPVHYNHRAGGGRSTWWMDYVDGPTSPLYPFGHGLGFSSVEHEIVAATTEGTTRDAVDVTVTVTNTGTRRCTEVVQLYVRDDVASVARPDRQLVGLARVELHPGQRRHVMFGVHPSKLAFHDESMSRVCEPGTFTFMTGPSSGHLEASATVTLSGQIREHRQRDVVATTVEVAETAPR
jgi:beta-glucosidase